MPAYRGSDGKKGKTLTFVLSLDQMLREGVSDEATGFLPDDDDCVLCSSFSSSSPGEREK